MRPYRVAPGRAVLFLAAVMLLLLPAAASAALRVGDTAPNFSLPDTAGQYHSLSDHAGKVVLLNFWVST